jgi:hypothetical protein
MKKTPFSKITPVKKLSRLAVGPVPLTKVAPQKSK